MEVHFPLPITGSFIDTIIQLYCDSSYTEVHLITRIINLWLKNVTCERDF